MIITGKKFSKPKLSRIINGDDELKAAPERVEKFRLDHLLMEKYPELKRATLQKLVKNGLVKVDGEVVLKTSAKFEKTAKIEAKMPGKTVATPKKIFEDENVLVLNKPAGMLSMAKGELCPETTLEDFGLLVHRLDRDTSGVVILAKNPETQSFLRKQFQDRKTHKTYFAIVDGEPKLPEAKIDLPIARDLARPTTFRVDEDGREAVTFYRTLKTDGEKSLLELKPVTGRTHQLRVHLKYIGNPILGDRVYNEKSSAARLFLHAASLEITIPGAAGGVRKTFTVPLPEEFENVF